MSKLIENLKAARMAGVPLLAIVTQDQPATVDAISTGVNGCPQVKWDCINGLVAVNEEGKAALAALPPRALEDSPRPVFAFRAMLHLPPKTMVFAYNGNAYLGEPPVVQAIQNLREPLKENKRTVLLLGSNFAEMPQTLQADVVTLEEKPPTEEQLSALLTDLHESAHKTLDPAALPSMIDAVRGLPSLFTSEQVISMSFRKNGLDMDTLWERKESAINATKGLHISRGGMKYADLAGMDVIMGFLRSIAGSVRVVLHLDEIEKALAGSSGDQQDTSGVSSDFLGVLLKKMENLRWKGAILAGVPGSGKTALSEATAGEFGVPRIEMDFGGMKDKWVGSSEGAVRAAFDVIEALGGKDVLVLATCNKLNNIPPELRRRFTLGGVWYFDVPTLEEQEPIKRIYEKKLGLAGQEWPDTTGYTGAEIRNLAELAVLTKSSLKAASAFIVPVSVSDPESVVALRKLAEGRFLSVARPGRWTADPIVGKAKRQIGTREDS